LTRTCDFVKIENEYGPVEYEIGAPGKSYTKWAADMAIGLGTGVPWIMCKQDDAPDPVVSLAELYRLKKVFVFWIQSFMLPRISAFNFDIKLCTD
jgi:hypothetical protein